MSEKTGQVPTEEDPSRAVQAALNLPDGLTITIRIQDGRISVTPDRTVSGSQMYAVLSAALAAFYMEMDRQSAIPEPALQH